MIIRSPYEAVPASRSSTQQRHAKCLHSILHECNTGRVRIEWSDEFDHWFAKLEQKVDAGDILAEKAYNYIAAAFDLLRRLSEAPEFDDGTAQLKPVRQSRRYQVWRTAHAFDPDVAVRLIVWFPPDSDCSGHAVRRRQEEHRRRLVQQRRHPRRRCNRAVAHGTGR
jgi:hypothetical protein